MFAEVDTGNFYHWCTNFWNASLDVPKFNHGSGQNKAALL